MVRRQLSLTRHPSTAPRLPEFLRQGVWSRITAFCSEHLNFYRVHLLVFIFTPLVFSGIFYASNGPSPENQIAYVDALFMCTSGMAVTGLNTVELTTMTTWQQFIIFFLTSIGSTSFVSIIVIGIRRQFFRNKFDYMVQHDEEARNRVNLVGAEEAARAGREYRAFDADHPPVHAPWIANLLGGGKMPTASTPVTPRPSPAGSKAPTIDEDRTLTAGGGGGATAAAMRANRKKNKKLGRLRADMIKRVDVPVRINEMSVSGWLKERRAAAAARGSEDEAAAGGSSEDDDDEDDRNQVEMSDFPITRPGGRPGATAAGIRRLDVRDDDLDHGYDGLDQVSILQQHHVDSPGSMDGHGFDATASTNATAPPTGIMFSEPSAHARRRFSDESGSEAEAEEEGAAASESESPRPPRGRSFTLQSRDGGRGLMTPPLEREASPAGQPDVAGHIRAIHIDEPERPPHPRYRRNSDSAASPNRRSNNLAFGRTRTFDHSHLREITESPSPLDSPLSPTVPRQNLDFGRSRTIEFQDPSQQDLRMRRNRTLVPRDPDAPAAQRRPSHSNLQGRDVGARTLTRTTTIDQTAMQTGFGGFPNPLRAAARYAQSKIGVLQKVERNITMPRTTTMLSTHSHNTMSGGVRHEGTGHIKPVSYITFDATVGRNSRFHGLTTAQQEELGGVEYRALSVLFKIVIGYWLGIQLICVAIVAPYITYVDRWRAVINQSGISPVWFTFFQFWSAYSNLGMSLVDASMVPFQQCYYLIVFQGLLILGGNTAFPVFLRLLIYIMSKLIPRQSQLHETLQFLLDHPRRCFIYLFPSHQTWLLVFMLVLLNGIDWAAFCILDIGNQVVEALPVGTRIIDGLFQAFAVRAAGFSIVAIAQTAPALQLLYVIMMYIAVYPIAVSIRSTNVYEEKSMGVYDEDFDEDPDDVEARFDKNHSATAYIGYHARKQLAFDMWWLVLAIWLICIVERHRIGSPDWPEVSIFSLLFEIVSAYGTVGLSLGNNRNNTALAGVLSTLSKLIICAVMVRGRHRGLPIAIDRAVLLPSDLQKHGDDTATRTSVDTSDLRLRPSRTSMSSMTAVGTRRDGGGGFGASGTGSMMEDEGRHVRRGSLGASSIYSGRDRAPRGEREDLGDLGSVHGFDHFHDHAPRSSDLSDDKDAGLASGSSGEATTSLDSDKKLDEDGTPDGDGQIHDRNKPGWR